MVGVGQTQRTRDGEVAVQGDGYEDEGREVESKGPEEHEGSAGSVSGLPGHGEVPANLQGHHDEGHDHVSDRKMHDEPVDPRSPMTVPKQRHKHHKVAKATDN